jgi:hypothetical protein
MAHLHALLAADCSLAILLKRGPQGQTLTIGWDRSTDTFTEGQCVGKRIDFENTDLSPDGKHFIYYVNDGTWNRKNHVYRAISLAPWLKALTFCGSEPEDYGPGTGLFFKEDDGVTRVRVKSSRPSDWDQLGLPIVPYDTDTPRWRSVIHPESAFFTKLQRDGWTARTPWEICPASEAEGEASWRSGSSPPHRILFDKVLPHGWTLRQTHWCGLHGDMNRGVAWQTFALGAILDISVVDGARKQIWRGLVFGSTNQQGMPFKVTNYQEALSDSLLRTYKDLFQQLEPITAARAK